MFAWANVLIIEPLKPPRNRTDKLVDRNQPHTNLEDFLGKANELTFFDWFTPLTLGVCP